MMYGLSKKEQALKKQREEAERAIRAFADRISIVDVSDPNNGRVKRSRKGKSGSPKKIIGKIVMDKNPLNYVIELRQETSSSEDSSSSDTSDGSSAISLSNNQLAYNKEKQSIDDQNLDKAIKDLKAERAKHVKEKIMISLKDQHMKDPSVSIQLYKQQKRFLRENE